MPSYAARIADAVVNVLSTLVNGLPVDWRKTDAVLPRESIPRVVVTIGTETVLNRGTFGGLSQAGRLGSIMKGYPIQVAIYGSNLGDLAGDDVNPSLILRCKQALNTAALAGVDEVWDTDLVENAEWENNTFRDGAEVSRFAVIFYTSEPRNG